MVDAVKIAELEAGEGRVTLTIKTSHANTHACTCYDTQTNIFVHSDIHNMYTYISTHQNKYVLDKRHT